MTRQEIDDALSKTLEDHRLTRTEKRALSEVLAALPPGQLTYFRSQAFAMAADAMARYEDRNILTWLEEVTKVIQHISEGKNEGPRPKAYFSPKDDCPARIVDLFEKARRSVDVCVFTITDDRVSKAIAAAHLRNIKVRVITDDDKTFDRGAGVDRLKAAGIEVRMDTSEDHMHHKYALFDEKVLLTGSYNWTRGAAHGNQENFLVIEEPHLVGQYQDEFARLWKQFG